MLEILEEYSITLLSIGLSLMIVLFKNVKSKRLRRIANKLIVFSKITQELVIQAEEFIHFKGAEKKEWVKTKINQYAIDHKLPYDEHEIDNMIEEFIHVSKNVNRRGDLL